VKGPGPFLRLASANPAKARELAALFPEFRLEPLGPAEYPPEQGTGYYENARAKALFGRGIAERAAWVLAEDSGIEVRGLGWRPGIESARFGGEQPPLRLLAALAGIEGEGRRARYVCELVCISPGGEELRGSGVLEGTIAHECRGAEGFGCDPVFVPSGERHTVAELGNEWKASHSHRARAAEALRALLGAD
jgi:XTP/dITP diphosphohydrolase